MKGFPDEESEEKERETIVPDLAAGERLLNAIGYYRRDGHVTM